MRTPRITVLLIGSLICGIVQGCALFRGGETTPPSTWPLANGPGRQSISLIVSGEARLDGNRVDVHQAALKAWQVNAERAYRDSGLFSEVHTSAADTDLRAEIQVMETGSANRPLAFFSGFTMTIIPARATGTYLIKTTFKNKAGQELGAYEVKESSSFWIQLFLIFVMPFNWPNTVASEMLYDLNRSTIAQAFGAGHLQANEELLSPQWALASQ